MEVDGTGGPSCLTEASANTQGAANALRDRKPDLQSRLNHVRCALSATLAAVSARKGASVLRRLSSFRGLARCGY